MTLSIFPRAAVFWLKLFQLCCVVKFLVISVHEWVGWSVLWPHWGHGISWTAGWLYRSASHRVTHKRGRFQTDPGIGRTQSFWILFTLVIYLNKLIVQRSRGRLSIYKRLCDGMYDSQTVTGHISGAMLMCASGTMDVQNTASSICSICYY